MGLADASFIYRTIITYGLYLCVFPQKIMCFFPYNQFLVELIPKNSNDIIFILNSINSVDSNANLSVIFGSLDSHKASECKRPSKPYICFCSCLGTLSLTFGNTSTNILVLLPFLREVPQSVLFFCCLAPSTLQAQLPVASSNYSA